MSRRLRKRYGHAGRRQEGKIAGFKRDKKRIYFVTTNGTVMSVQRKNA